MTLLRKFFNVTIAVLEREPRTLPPRDPARPLSTQEMMHPLVFAETQPGVSLRVTFDDRDIWQGTPTPSAMLAIGMAIAARLEEELNARG